jgi:hypothetical protein
MMLEQGKIDAIRASDFTEGVAGMCIIATLAKLLNGMVLDEYEGPQDAEGGLRIARENLAILLEDGGLPPDLTSSP